MFLLVFNMTKLPRLFIYSFIEVEEEEACVPRLFMLLYSKLDVSCLLFLSSPPAAMTLSAL